jgi:type IV pilus assembly protein PilW
MKPSNPHPRFYQNGFSLVEILVGLAIGLLATLVVLQVFSVFEGQKRTTTGTADAQTNGNVALYSIKRDLGMAGYGLLPIINTPLDCGTVGFNIDTAATGIADVSHFSPVTIIDGGTGAGASDIITIRYSSSGTGGAISQIVTPPAGNTVAVGDTMACNPGDLALVIHSSKGSCGLTSVASLNADHQNINLTSMPAGTANGENVSCLGKWKEIEYRINQTYDPTVASKSQAYLQRKESTFPIPLPNPPGNPATGDPIVADIVNIQAQYGISLTADSNKIIQWVNAKDAAGWNTAIDGPKVIDPATGAATDFGPGLTILNRNLIKAARIAVVARNGLLEKTNPDGTDVTSACGPPPNQLTIDAPTGLCAWAGSSAGTVIANPAPAIDLSNDPNWQHYRYRVFETIIPMRNVIWSGTSLP